MATLGMKILVVLSVVAYIAQVVEQAKE